MSTKMTKEELIVSASYAIMKEMSCDTLRMSDEMYGKEDQTEDVWEFIEESQEIGLVAFREKYKDYDMYPI